MPDPTPPVSPRPLPEPDGAELAEPVRVSRLVEKARRHLEQFGDGPVGIVINGQDQRDVLHVEPVLRLGYDTYDVGGPCVFEVEADTEERCPARAAARAELAALREAATALRDHYSATSDDLPERQRRWHELICNLFNALDSGERG